METNESILGREIVAITDQKRVGKIEDVCIDADARAVSGFMVQSATTGTSLVLPFEKAMAIGDAFMTIDMRDDLLTKEMDQAKESMAQGFKLLGLDVFSRLGNALGTIEGYTFDPTYGTITEVVLNDGTTFSSDKFIFFAPDMVFMNDGGVTADELRRGKGRKGKAAKKAVKKPAKSVARKSATKPAVAKLVAKVEPKPESKPEATPEAKPVAEPVNKDTNVKDFLLGLPLIDDVESVDGEFKVTAGTLLTKEIIDEAAAHDALLLLTLSVED